tara:strand:+ start:593 stop:1120 length:528 start_codon:yes stop_codon:yes gene_type:complete
VDPTPEDELRRIDRTFAFIDLSGFTAFTDAEGDGAAVRVLEEFRRTVRWVVARRGVRIAKWLGDGAMLVGVEPEQTVEAVVEIEARVHRSESPLPLRAGIARGPVLLIEGDDHIGDAVNLASRLCHMAEPQQVLAPASLVSSLMVNTVERPIGDRDVDGFAEPLPVVELLSADRP